MTPACEPVNERASWPEVGDRHGQRLTAVETLRGELARVIYAQQGGARAAVRRVEIVVGDRVGRRGTRGDLRSAERPQTVIERRDEPVGPTRGLLHGAALYRAPAYIRARGPRADCTGTH